MAEKMGAERLELARAYGMVPSPPRIIPAIITGPTPSNLVSLEDRAIPPNAPSPPIRKIVPTTAAV